MNKQFIQQNFCNAEIARPLRELGFNDLCLGFYDEANEFHECQTMQQNQFIPFAYCTVPTYWQAIAWLLTTHNLSVIVQGYGAYNDEAEREVFYGYFIHNYNLSKSDENNCITGNIGTSFSECATKAILKAIEILKSQQVQS